MSYGNADGEIAKYYYSHVYLNQNLLSIYFQLTVTNLVIYNLLTL